MTTSSPSAREPTRSDPDLPTDAGICAFDLDEATVTLALSDEAEVLALVAKLPGRNRVRIVEDDEPEDDSLAALLTELTRLKGENERLREGLKFYADPSSWTEPSQVNRDEMFDTPVQADNYGDRARVALAEGRPDVG